MKYSIWGTVFCLQRKIRTWYGSGWKVVSYQYPHIVKDMDMDEIIGYLEWSELKETKTEKDLKNESKIGKEIMERHGT